MSVPSPDLVGGPDLSLQQWGPVQPIGLKDLESVPARRVVVWGARGVRVGEARNPGPDDIMAPTQWESGAHFSEESRAPGLTVRQESDTESVASVNRDNEVTVSAPVDASAADLPRVGSRRIRRLVLAGSSPPQNQVAEEVDLTVADSPSEPGGSSAEVAEEVVHDNQIPQNSRRDFELMTRCGAAPSPTELDAFQGNCHKCGKFGHTAKECRSSNHRGAQKPQCAQCGKETSRTVLDTKVHIIPQRFTEKRMERRQQRKRQGNPERWKVQRRKRRKPWEKKRWRKERTTSQRNHRTTRRKVDRWILRTMVRTILEHRSRHCELAGR